jgi:hypothetical protein
LAPIPRTPAGQVALALVVLVCGCALRAAPPSGTPERHVTARSVRGHPIEVFSCGDGPGGVLVIGGTHGDERGSAALVRELTARLRCAPDGGRLTLVPALNPDGLRLAERPNARGVDLNRNLPTSTWAARAAHGPQPISEPESRALYELLLRVRPAFTLSLHEGNEPLVDWDGPADDAARALGACTGLEVRRIGAMPGSLGSLLGVDWGWPLVTLELPREASSVPAETVWAWYGDCLLAAIGPLPGTTGARQAVAPQPHPDRGSRPAWRRRARALW